MICHQISTFSYHTKVGSCCYELLPQKVLPFYDDIYYTTCNCMEFERVEKPRSFNDIDVIKCNCIFTFLVHVWNLNIGTMFIACKFSCIKSLFTLLK